MHALSEPGASDDPQRFQKLLKEEAELQPITEAYGRYSRASQDQADALDMLEHENDPEMREMLKAELSASRQEIAAAEQELQILLLPKDPNDDKNIYMEIRAGVGGDESALFAADLYRMYCNYAMRNGWKTELASFNETGIGGFKEITFMINGRGAYS